jgi:hypothetical protein
MPVTTVPSPLSNRRSDTNRTPATSKTISEPRTSPHLDLRIVAFMLVVAVVQLLSFKRPLA